MTFSIKITDLSSKNNNLRIKYEALKRISKYTFFGNEIKLNNYLKKYKNAELRSLCFWLVRNKIKINYDKTSKVAIISFIDSNSEDIAKLITFGNLEAPGSNILKFAFEQKY